MDAMVDVPVDVSGRQLGRAFVEAIRRRDFDALEALFAPDLRFRALVPKAIREGSTAAEARAFIAGWFDDCEAIEVVETEVEPIVDRLHVGYRLQFRQDGVPKRAEQQSFGIVRDGRFADLSLVCSGFRPITDAASGEPDARLDAKGDDCATLTPRIRTAMRELRSGEVLEVVADDPAAEEGLKSWSRLTGNELIAVERDDGTGSRFYLRRG